MRAEVLDATKLIEFVDDNFKLDNNDGSFFKWVEKSVEKGKNCSLQAMSPFERFELQTSKKVDLFRKRR